MLGYNILSESSSNLFVRPNAQNESRIVLRMCQNVIHFRMQSLSILMRRSLRVVSVLFVLQILMRLQRRSSFRVNGSVTALVHLVTS